MAKEKTKTKKRKPQYLKKGGSVNLTEKPKKYL